MSESDKKQLFDRFLEWAGSQNDIKAVALVGSAARAENPADEWSDYDLLLIVSDPQIYLADTKWFNTFGISWCNILEKTSAGEPIERRVLFEGGLDMDFIILSEESARKGFQNTPIVSEISQRGRRVLWDRDHLFPSIPLSTTAVLKAQRPTQPVFLDIVNDFWFHAAWTAKKLCRGELWIAKRCCDQYLKNLLLQMIEWEAQSLNSWDINTWFDGRFLEQWASTETVAELRKAFAHYETEDIWQALDATMLMFRRMARATAKRLDYSYPVEADERVSLWIAQIRKNAGYSKSN